MVEPQKKEQPAGFGSIWNNNNWFFEEKNYTKFAKEWLTQNICQISAQRDGVTVSLYEMKSIEGQASVTIRKQKQLFLYDFEMEIYFRATRDNQDDFDNEDEKSVTGKFKVFEFNQEDDDEINLDITQEKSSELAALSKKIINVEVSKSLLTCISALKGAMQDKDSDEIKLKRDAANREEAKKTAEEAKEKSGALKQQIFEESKAKEAAFKAQQEKMAAQKLVPMKADSQINEKTGTGSVWNNNSYHWEEKSVSKWSEDTLKGLFTRFYFKQHNATITIKEVKKFEGESSVSVRKGKKIVTYDYQVRLVWKAVLADGSGSKPIGSCEGEYFFPEISNDEEDMECEASIYAGGEDEAKKTLYQMIKQLAPDEMKKQVRAQFVEELMKK